MKFVLGKVPENKNFDPESEGWNKFKEPGPILMQFIALPIGMIIVALIVWFVVKNIEVVDVYYHIEIFYIFVLIFLVIAVHEILHLICHPNMGKTNKSFLGFWPSRLLFYAHYEGEVSKARFGFILFTPLLFLTIMPIIIAYIFQKIDELILFMVIINTLAGCGDVLGLLILFQVPKGSVIKNQGYTSWWK